MSIRLFFLKGRIKKLERLVEHYYNQRRHYAQQAYDIPDMLNQPLLWGRLQNEANWANHHYRRFHDELTAARKKLADKELVT